MNFDEKPQTHAKWMRAAMWGVAAILAAVLIVRYWQPLVSLVSEQERLRMWIEGFGWAAPIVLILVQAVQVVLAPVPGQIVGLVSGYLFGTLWGTIYSMVGILLGAWTAMALARRLGRPFIQRFVPAKHLAKFDDLADRGGATAFFVLFLLPFVPDDSITIIAGLTSISIPLLMVLAAVGRLPSILASSFIGDRSGSLTLLQWAILGATSLVVGIPVLVYRKRLETFVERLAARLSRSEKAVATHEQR
jgi:uncharacterized membrane protein YdjX (TVP38/TMEM64 family)